MDEFTEPASLPTRMLYSTPNNRTAQKLVRSDIGTPSYTRAPGEAPGTFALEVAMDELAYALKLDPLELRMKNYAERDEDKNLPWSTKSLKECYRQGAARFGWARRNPEPRTMREGTHSSDGEWPHRCILRGGVRHRQERACIPMAGYWLKPGRRN